MPSCSSDLVCTSNYNPFNQIPIFRMPDKLPLKQAWKGALRYEEVDHLKLLNVCIKQEMKMWSSCISYQMETVHSLRYLFENLSSKMILFLAYFMVVHLIIFQHRQSTLKGESFNKTVQFSLKYELGEEHRCIIRKIQDLKAKLIYISLPANWLV